MKTATRLICSAALLTGAFFVSSTLACTTIAWTSTSGAPLADDPTNGVSRVSGFCGLHVTANDHVIDNSPAGETETTFIARFYFLPLDLPGPGPHKIFVALSDQSDPNSNVVVITYDGTNVNLDATAVGGGTASVAVDSSHWHLVEFLWNSGGQGSLFVDRDSTENGVTPNATFDSGTGSIDQVKLGAVSDISNGSALFDDYESHRSLPVGALLIGDGNADGSVNSGDIISIINEFFQAGLSEGTPDCNLDGNVNSGDIICIINTFFAG